MEPDLEHHPACARDRRSVDLRGSSIREWLLGAVGWPGRCPRPRALRVARENHVGFTQMSNRYDGAGVDRIDTIFSRDDEATRAFVPRHSLLRCTRRQVGKGRQPLSRQTSLPTVLRPGFSRFMSRRPADVTARE